MAQRVKAADIREGDVCKIKTIGVGGLTVTASADAQPCECAPNDPPSKELVCFSIVPEEGVTPPYDVHLEPKEQVKVTRTS